MIWLLRHAEAEPGSPDEARKLTPKGEEQARNAGLALARLGVKPDLCLTSPRVRAVQTAELACEPLGVPVTIEPRLSGGPFDPEELATGVGEVLLVGHDPDFSMAVHDMTGAQVRLRKGGLAAVNKGELVVLLRPRETTEIAR
ncbi:MAG TPA: histidine phosphatase family protein [Thermoleophilaceae bacterium]|jgi:phosphohistidine phosphatase|nr:histidine phosphatase family protein [Thermoleophilaceae bacterium]